MSFSNSNYVSFRSLFLLFRFLKSLPWLLLDELVRRSLTLESSYALCSASSTVSRTSDFLRCALWILLFLLTGWWLNLLALTLLTFDRSIRLWYLLRRSLNLAWRSCHSNSLHDFRLFLNRLKTGFSWITLIHIK